MIVTNTSALESPVIDAAEARWASAELASMIAHLGPDSPVNMVLRQARREINSLVQNEAGSVVGPFRVAA